MLIPTPKFLVLPLIALAVIAALPSQNTGTGQREIRTSPATEVANYRIADSSHSVVVASALAAMR